MAALDSAKMASVPPLAALQGDLVVASYNLLAPCFVRPVDARTGGVQPFAAFAWCDDAVLEWPRRRDALAKTLRQIAQRCDVVCLQEVEFGKDGDERVPPAWLREALEGFKIVACKASILERNAKRNLRVVGKDVAVTTAIAVGRGWRVAWTGDGNGTTNVLVGVAKEGATVAVASMHLDAGAEEKRVSLLAATLTAARARSGGGNNLRVVVAGDMNAEFCVGSALGAVCSPEGGDAADALRECAVALRRAPDDAELAAWAELRQKARLDTKKTLRSGGLLGRVPTGATRCGYDHEVADSKEMAQWRLDHLLYSPATLTPTAWWATLEADPKSLAEGLPNAEWPSDHAPVAAAFAVAPPPTGDLSETAFSDLRRIAQTETLAADAFVSADADDAAADDAATVAAKPKGGGKQQRKEKPSPEAIERKRRRRKRKQDHDAARAARRAEFVSALDQNDYDALETLVLRAKLSADAVGGWSAGNVDMEDVFN